MKIALNLFLFMFLLACQSINNSAKSIVTSYEKSRDLELKAESYKLVDSLIYSEISIPLANSVLNEYLNPNTKDSLELYFDEYAGEKWGDVKQLNEIDSIPFEHEFFGEGVFTSIIEKTIIEDNYS